MFDRLTNCDKTEYFKELAQRSQQKVIFHRFIGYDREDQFLLFLRQFYRSAQESGAYLKEPLKNPSEAQISEWRAAIPGDILLTPEAISSHLTVWLAFPTGAHQSE